MAKSKVLAGASDWVLANIFGTQQAKVASIGYAVIFASTLASLIWKANSSDDKSKMSGIEIAVVCLFLIIGYLLSIYSIACLTRGGCVTWSWINAAVVIVLALLVFLSTFF
jgi:apolipoprotein N-acyltransferase